MTNKQSGQDDHSESRHPEKSGLRPLALLWGAIVFYTIIPIPSCWRPRFDGIAYWAPVIGVLLGGLLGLIDWGLFLLGMPTLVRSAVVVALWVAVTGGLHLDGAMDSADGLAVLDPQRRLDVMADSRTGAFGAMAAVLILLLKTAALASLSSHRWFMLLLVAGWGRWGQLLAIARYPYLRATGKGALHKAVIQSSWTAAPTFILLVGLGTVYFGMRQNLGLGLAIGLVGGTVAWWTGAWFNRRLGGHTGDTYGATVEWTETFMLCLLTLVP
jgi:adenosylcobinamide-GDP ribazoletransferase